MDPKKPQINVELSSEQAEGIYSNFVLITHSPSEFILDFARMVPGVQKTKVYVRVIMNPQNALLLKNALDENLKKYEERFGKIKIFGKEDKEIGFK
jgi:hypothetical protein